MVAGPYRFAHRSGAVGLQSREEDGGFHLRAGHRSGVVDRRKLAAVDGDGRVAVGERDAAPPSA